LRGENKRPERVRGEVEPVFLTAMSKDILSLPLLLATGPAFNQYRTKRRISSVVAMTRLSHLSFFPCLLGLNPFLFPTPPPPVCPREMLVADVAIEA